MSYFLPWKTGIGNRNNMWRLKRQNLTHILYSICLGNSTLYFSFFRRTSKSPVRYTPSKRLRTIVHRTEDFTFTATLWGAAGPNDLRFAYDFSLRSMNGIAPHAPQGKSCPQDNSCIPAIHAPKGEIHWDGGSGDPPPYSDRRAVTGSCLAALREGIRPPRRVRTMDRVTRMAAAVGGR